MAVYQDFPAAGRILSPRSTILAGDPATSLDGLNTIGLADGCMCVVQENGDIYVLRKTSVVAASPPGIVMPLTGPGRWFLFVGAGMTSSQIRWYGKVPADSLTAKTGITTRLQALTEQAGIPDPMDLLDTLSGASAEYSVPRATKVTRFAMTRDPGEPGTDPTGDDPIVWTLQTFNATTTAQATVTSATLSYNPAEYGAKSVDINFDVASGLYLFVRADYPTNWLQQNRSVVDYQTVDLLS